MSKLLFGKQSEYQRAALPESAVTATHDYLNRRQFIQRWGMAGLALATTSLVTGTLEANQPSASLKSTSNSQYDTTEALTDYESVTTYNNYYEFGTGKSDPARHAHQLITDPWSVEIRGAAKQGSMGLDQLIDERDLERRIYRLRCVEGWSMVIPWIGIPLRKIIQRLEPDNSAKYVEFTTLADPQQMPGIRRNVLDWPYREGLTMAEAMNPLTLLAVGLYDEYLPKQNGAPLRLVVPWKYGFKSIKSIVGIDFTRQQPLTSWNKSNAQEYGFYSNVNPEVAHPRWSQARERRIGEDSFFTPKRETLMFNGYAEQVAHLYAGMDLRKHF